MPPCNTFQPRAHAVRSQHLNTLNITLTDTLHSFVQRPAATISTMYTPYFIHAEWDAEAAVWVATSNDVPGLATEADTLEALAAKLRVMVPELLQLNGGAAEEISWELLARRFDSTHASARA